MRKLNQEQIRERKKTEEGIETGDGEKGQGQRVIWRLKETCDKIKVREGLGC